MAARSYWRGYLRLSLVTIGIELYSAVSSASSLALHQIHKPSGQRIRYQKIAPGVGPVEADQIVKGYEVDRREYVLLEPEELNAIKLETKRTIDLVQFVDRDEIDPRYYEKPYYVVPAEDEVAADGFAVIREALRSERKTGLGQMAVRGRDNIVAISACGDGLLLETLRYADEVRASDRIFSDIPDIDVDAEMLDLARELIRRKTSAFDPTAFASQYNDALRALIEEKRRTGVVHTREDERAPARGNVIDLMEALKRSVARDRGGKTPDDKPAQKRSASRKSAPKRTGEVASRRNAAR